MPAIWVVCPVVLDRAGRKPLVSTLTDPGRRGTETVDRDGNHIFVPKTCGHISAPLPGGVALTLCFAASLDNVRAHPAIADGFIPEEWSLTEIRAGGYLDASPKERGWGGRQIKRFRDEIEARGVSLVDLDDTEPLWVYLQRLGRTGDPKFDPRKVKAYMKGVE